MELQILFSASSSCRSTAATSGRRNFRKPLVDAELHAGLDQPDRGTDFLRVVAVDGRGLQPPREGKAEGLDGGPVAAGDAAAQRGQGQAGVFQAVESAFLFAWLNGRGRAWQVSFQFLATPANHN